ncbi:hypothetical protein E4U17_006477 [Claviceps sp. LM77 group G4]|nr:hypothetical protein E4U17_006477 [Claviceps sp. LM77 group G4]KAG6078187.1 hypothetical protein E4U33_000848 [Claviceps sp. LM78 group G4]
MSAQSSIDFEGPLSPVSSRMDALMDKSSALTTAYSAPSSCADSWSNGHGDRDDPGEGDSDVPLDYLDRGPTATASVTVLKLEPTDDDINLDDVTTGPVPLDAAHGASEAKQKRPRGRPRKMLADTAIFTSKIMKGRSKTGCITCRRRKKKCDESKPRCMNCEKNAVLCEGYHEKQLWRSKRVKAEEGKFSILRCSSTQSSTTSLCPISDTDRLFAELIQQDSQPVITMQPIFHGVETVEDRILWKHYFTHLSNVLTVEGEAKNAFKDIILPLANEHQGLMHSILAVSSKHIDLDSPYGSRILNDNPTATRESLQHRGDFHHDEALNRLFKDLDTLANKDDPAYATVLAARYGQMLCLLLQTRAEGNPRGEHRVHLQAYQTLIQHSPPENEVFRSFITEFFQYHIFADDLLWYSGLGCSRLLSENLLRHVSVPKARLIGIGDGLFRCLSQITTLRNLIREKIAASREPIVDYTSLYRAAEIDAVIRDWIPRWPPGDSRHRVGPLYRQMMWVYLYRTIYPPLPWPPPRPTITTGPSNRDQSHMSDVQRRSSMVSMDSSVGSSAASNTMSPCRTEYGSHAVHSCSSSRNPSRTNSMHEIDWTPSIVERSQMPSEFLFPPLTTRSSHDDSRIKLAVEESLTIFESFSLSDPAQTLLLIPCIIIGTACFNVRQRERLRAVIKVIRGYTGLRNCDRLTELLEEVWSQMDKGEWMVAWDWQAIAKSLHLDFICA